MAAGAAGDARMGDADTIPNLRATMESMSYSIAALANQMAELREDPGQFFRRVPEGLTTPSKDMMEKGPAVRKRIYAQTVESDRLEKGKTSLRINDLEGMIAFYNSELTTDRNNMEAISNAIKDIRSGMSSPPCVRSRGREGEASCYRDSGVRQDQDL